MLYRIGAKFEFKSLFVWVCLGRAEQKKKQNQKINKLDLYILTLPLMELLGGTVDLDLDTLKKIPTERNLLFSLKKYVQSLK